MPIIMPAGRATVNRQEAEAEVRGNSLINKEESIEMRALQAISGRFTCHFRSCRKGTVI